MSNWRTDDFLFGLEEARDALKTRWFDDLSAAMVFSSTDEGIDFWTVSSWEDEPLAEDDPRLIRLAEMIEEAEKARAYE
jgi:hypothetical protein